MDSDQTATKSDVGLYNLKYRLPKKQTRVTDDKSQDSVAKGKVNEDHFELLPFFLFNDIL